MFQDEVPTKSLIPSLSILSTHLSHFAPILPIGIRLPIYRNVAKELSNAVVEKVIIAGQYYQAFRVCLMSLQRLTLDLSFLYNDSLLPQEDLVDSTTKVQCDSLQTFRKAGSESFLKF